MNTRKRLFSVVTSGFLALSMTIAPLATGFVNVTAYAKPEVGVEGLAEVPAPIDPQSWQMGRDMTWDQLKVNPVVDWNKFDISKTKTDDLKGILVLVDFADTKFIVTQEKGSDVFGNPVFTVPQGNLNEFWNGFLNVPQESNHGLSIHNHWLETTFGKWNVTLKTIGPYTVPGYEFEYGVYDPISGQASDKPPGYQSRRLLGPDALAEIKKEGLHNVEEYDFIFFLHAGYDESGTWQEFGEMKYNSKYDVPRELGPLATLQKIGIEKFSESAVKWAIDRDAINQNYARSRYGNDPWCSWYVATGIWPHKTTLSTGTRSMDISIQGENGGMGTFSHEFGHIKGLTDNYNDQFIEPIQRTNVGNWDIMATGNWAGPGGNHNRWKIPTGEGASTPSLMSLRTKLYLNLLDPAKDIVDVDIEDLRAGTPVVADILSRNIPVGDAFGISGKVGLRINNMADKKPQITRAQSWWDSDTWRGSDATNGYKGYTMEVIDRSSYDSFMADSGVVIAKYRLREQNPTTWFVDAHPEDINEVDFLHPTTGEPVMYRKGSVVQLNDALFHAGVSEGVVNEYEDTYNGLKFYILDKKYSQAEFGQVLSYQVGVLSTEGKPVGGALEVVKGKLTPATAGRVAVQEFSITNTGDATDIVKVSVGGTLTYETTLLNNLYAIKAGETITVPVYISIPEQVGFAAASFTLKELDVVGLTLTATSESNPAKTSGATSEDIANNSTINKLIVKADKTIVNKNDYFDVNVSFTEKVASNTAILTFTFDSGKFDYRGLGLATGVKELNTVVNGNTLKITVMVDDYNTLDYGFVRFSAKDDIDLTNKANEIVVNASLVVKDGDKKTIEDASGSTVLFTGLPGDTNNDGKVDLIDLSNMIDYFGFDKKTTDWDSKYAAFDFNRNGKIDISDITEVAKLIK